MSTDERHPCDRCGARYRPRLTRGDCPVCGLAAPAALRPDPGAFATLDPDTRMVVLVAAATVGNLLVLAVLALVLLRV